MKILALIAVAVFAQAAGQQKTTPPAGPELQFNWPDRVDARVETERSRKREGGGSQSYSVRTTYRMRVGPHPSGRVIRFEDFQQVNASGSGARAVPLTEQVLGLMPSLVVDKDGGLVRVEDLAALRAAVIELARPVRNAGAEMPPGFRDLLDRLTSEEFLSSLAAQEWQLLAGTWIGLPLVREMFELAVEEPSPLWPDIKVPMKVAMGLAEHGECTRAGVAHPCAVLQLRSAVDQAAMKLLMRRLLEGAKAVDGIKFEHFDVVTVVRIRLETKTMLPHELTSEKTVNVAISGDPTAMKQIDRRTSRFSY